MKQILAGLICLITGTASAQEFIDGTEKTLPPAALEKLLSASFYEFREPEVTRFSKLTYVPEGTLNIRGEPLPEMVQGWVNKKNEFGGYTGYRRFSFKLATSEFR